MAIKDSSFFGNNNGGGNGTNGKKPRDTKTWMNIGRVAPNGEFISLPLGIPLDNDDAKPLRGSPDFVQLMDAGNKMLAAAVAKTEALPKGEDTVYDPRKAAIDGAVAFAEGLDLIEGLDDSTKDELVKLFQQSVVVMPFAIQLRHAKGEAEAIEQNDMLGDFEL